MVFFAIHRPDRGQGPGNLLVPRPRRNGVHTTRGYCFRRRFLSNPYRMQIVTYNLESTETTLEVELKGNPPPEHSKYRHKVIISIDDDGTLVVYRK